MSPIAATRRDPDATRRALLEAAFDEIYQQGFRAASLENILANTGLTKGALYHHFPNKQALGYAVLEEMIIPQAVAEWSALFDESRDPIEAMVEILEHEKTAHAGERMRMGCPINNLAQEMSAVDEGFRQRLMHFQEMWIGAVEKALARGQAAGQVRKDFNPRHVATMLVASFEGSAGVAKCHQDQSMFTNCMDSIAGFLQSLRP